MALFTDGPIIAPSDLENVENAILSVAEIEGIDLGGKIALAQRDIASQLVLFLLKRLPLRDLPWTQRRNRDVSDVVVTAPLRQWHIHRTLALVYRDAYNSQLNDRYQGKWAEYEQLAKESAENYLRIGVGLVADPIAKAATPILSTVTGSGAGATFFVEVTWVNQAGEEGAPSDMSQLTTSDGQQLAVACGSLPANVAGWNVYAGTSPQSLGLQNSIPMEANSSWAMAMGMQPGTPPPEGQQPTWYVMDQHVIQRG
ncbi:MAG TPA: hypothetical protein VMB25_06175 [Bryobacteraceae bacterium]|nr:hypothetical protein [Bryobacteraceae bacterium]